VVLALAEQPATWRYGYELCQRLDLTSGSLYPALMRLADRGLLETTWSPGCRPAAGRATVREYRRHGFLFVGQLLPLFGTQYRL
jgi:DNA-binding PadR family transcriptional regulator